MADTISSINEKIISTFTNIRWLNVIGWLVFTIISVGAIWGIYVYYKNKKQYNIRITAFRSTGGQWIPKVRDVAKTIKLGKGGFEIIYLKKLKTWRVAYGESVGANDYYFFIMPDGYWYNGILDANLRYIDGSKGMIIVRTTNPLMRGQYTALEKQIDSIHGQKQKWWDKYGTAVLGIAFILIAGVMLWLNYKQYVVATGNLDSAVSKMGDAISKMGDVLQKLSNLAGNIQSSGNSGMIPA